MKFLILCALVACASGYKQFISVDGRDVIKDDGRQGTRVAGSQAASGGGASGASSFGASLGGGFGGGSGFGSGSGSGGFARGSKGLAGGQSAIASPVNQLRAGGGGAGFSGSSYSAPISQQQEQGYAQLGASSYQGPGQSALASLGFGGGSGGYGGGAGGFGSGAVDSGAQAGGIIQAAVITKYRVQYVDVPSQGGAPVVQQIVIPAKSQPLDISFESQSSPINVHQVHIPGKAAEPQFSSHQEEPDVLKQEIIKPILHEVIEAIQPLRKITQEVRPVIEEVNQIISRGQQQTVAVAGSVQSQGLVGGGSGGLGSGGHHSIASQTIQSTPSAGLQISFPQKPSLAAPQVAQVGNQHALASGNRSLQQMAQQVAQQISQELIEKRKKAKKAAAARRA